MDPHVKLEVDAGVAVVTVDNPPINALSDRVLEQIGETTAGLKDAAVRAVVVTGTGSQAFLAGADLAEFDKALGDRDAMRGHTELTAAVFESWAEIEAPTIAAVQASAVGGGLEFALNCDLIVAAAGVRLGLPEVTLGLMPGAGGTQRLPRRIGSARAAEMLLTGRLVKAEDALPLGLIDRLAEAGEALADAKALAERIAALPAVAVRGAKAALRAARDLPLDQGLTFERERFLEVAASEDAKEGVSAFLAKRKPHFRNS